MQSLKALQLIDAGTMPVEPNLYQFLTVQAAISGLAERFRKAGLPSAELDARLLVLDACGLTREALILDPKRSLSSAQIRQISDFAIRRLQREPVSRILGRREFWGREFLIAPAVLDPRPDTETLIEAALKLVRKDGRSKTPLRILDLGTGSGCILLTLLAELPAAEGVGIDVDPAALHIAQENASRLGLTERANFVCADWCAGLSASFDLIVSNPPYIRHKEISGLEPEVRCFDPMRALDGQHDGLEAYRQIASGAFAVAAVGSRILLEAGYDQAQEIVKLFHQAGWCASEEDALIFPDLTGVNRVVAIMRQTQ